MKNQFKKGHCYKAFDEFYKCEFIGIYMGREQGYECMICGKGNNAHGFNIYQGSIKNPTKEEVENHICNIGYETWFYGNEHLPTMIEEIY